MAKSVQRASNAAGPVSPYLIRGLARLPGSTGRVALDVPCGGGRHTIHLAQQGYEVFAFDNDPKQIAKLRLALRSLPDLSVHTMLGDAMRPLPMPANSFDLVVTTHFVSPELLTDVPRVLRSGGVFLYETFAGHGENWRGLPKRGVISEQLSPHFEMLDYRERGSGPEAAEAVVVQLIARRR